MFVPHKNQFFFNLGTLSQLLILKHFIFLFYKQIIVDNCTRIAELYTTLFTFLITPISLSEVISSEKTSDNQIQLVLNGKNLIQPYEKMLFDHGLL